MNTVNRLFILLFLLLHPPDLLADHFPSHPPIFTLCVYAGGIEVLDSNTVKIIANGFNKEISLNGTWTDEKKGKQLLQNIVEGERVEVKIYGKDEECRNTGMLVIDGANMNEEMVRYGFKQKPFTSRTEECCTDTVRIQGLVPPAGDDGPSMGSDPDDGGGSTRSSKRKKAAKKRNAPGKRD